MHSDNFGVRCVAWASMLALSIVAAPVYASVSIATDELAQSLTAAARHADPGVVLLAARALGCASRSGLVSEPHTLSIIDYSRPSSEPRLWVFDLQHQSLLFEELVAHGRNSGGDGAPMRFSNADGSLMSSIGVFLTAETYTGAKGYALRLIGLEAGFNDHAIERAIVMHGAWYVDALLGQSQGRIGRSWGCPALRPAIARSLMDTIRGGSLLVAYYPDRDWLQRSAFVGECGDATRADSTARRP